MINREQIAKMKESGMKQVDIAKRLGCSKQNVSQTIKRTLRPNSVRINKNGDMYIGKKLMQRIGTKSIDYSTLGGKVFLKPVEKIESGFVKVGKDATPGKYEYEETIGDVLVFRIKE